MAILTGASSGLGEHFARVLHASGARVVAAARRTDRLEALARELPGLLPVHCDLHVWEDMERLIEFARDHLGPVDLLVNNAGIALGGIAAQDEERVCIEQTIALDLVAPLRLSQLVFPDMAARNQGVIVNVASVSGVVGIGRIPQASYAAAKGGLVALTRELAAQWGRHGIRVNAIAPGFFESDISAEAYANPKLAEWIERNTLLPRRSTVRDYGGTLLYLASGASSHVTGQVLAVDGGWTAR